MTSVRQLAACMGITRDFSILREFFGFFRGRLPSDPTGAAVVVSLRRQATRLRGRHHDLNCIAIGEDQFTDADDERIDYAIYRMRDIYDPASLGVARVHHFGVSTADADGLDSPTTRDDLEEITDRWSAANNGIDLFFPHNMNVDSVLGRSAVEGPCEDKDDKGMNGSVSGLWGRDQTARTVSHEVGHYLGLEHNHDAGDCPASAAGRRRLMAQSGCASNIRTSVELTSAEAKEMRAHCLVRGGC
ncbi:MAG: M12 family metallo-peptidase [Vicinamibacteraceae bacterium]